MREFVALADRHMLAQERLDYRSAIICSTLANVHRDPKSEPYSPFDFMPGKGEQKIEQTTDDMLRTVKLLNAAFGGEVIE